MTDRQYPCDTCGSNYTSKLAAAECEDEDREEDLRQRQWVRGIN